MRVFFTDRNFVTRQVEKMFTSVDNLLHAQALVTWTDITKTEKAQIALAKELGIPSIVIQHGRRAVVDYLPDYHDINSGNTQSKIKADHFCCWGQRDYNDLINAGYSPDKIHLVGCPLVPKVPEHREPKLIVFLSHHDLRKDTQEYNHKIHEKLVSKYGNKKVKLGDKQYPIYSMVVSNTYDNEKLTEYVSKHKSKVVYESDINEKQIEEKDLKPLSYAKVRIDSSHQKTWRSMASIFMNTKAVVTLMPSSFEGLACVMDIPIVRAKVDLGVRKGKEIDYELNDAVEPAEIKDLIKTIENLDPDKRRDARKQVAQQEMIVLGDPIDNIEAVIKGVINGH
jgi:hypothetical protein